MPTQAPTAKEESKIDTIVSAVKDYAAVYERMYMNQPMGDAFDEGEKKFQPAQKLFREDPEAANAAMKILSDLLKEKQEKVGKGNAKEQREHDAQARALAKVMGRLNEPAPVEQEPAVANEFLRVQINENVQLRELEPGGKLAVFSTDKNEFLKVGGKEITLEPNQENHTLALVLPAHHKLTHLDLLPRDAKGELLANHDTPWVNVENHGIDENNKRIDLSGNKIAVMGNASWVVTQFEIGGIDVSTVRNNVVDIKVGASTNVLPQEETGYPGAQFNFAGKSVVAIGDGFGSNIRFIAKDSNPKEPTTLLELDSNDDHGTTRGRIMSMQNGVIKKFAETLEGNDGTKRGDKQNFAKERREKLTELGMPGHIISSLPDGSQYKQEPWIDTPINKLYPAVLFPDEKEMQREKTPKTLDDLPLVAPDGRELVAQDKETSPRSPTKAEFAAALETGLDPQKARMLAQIKANGGFAKVYNMQEANHDSKMPLGGSGAGEERQR